MVRQILRHPTIAVPAAIITAAAIGYGTFTLTQRATRPDTDSAHASLFEGAGPAPATTAHKGSLRGKEIQSLVEGGWEEPAARAVIDFHAPLLEHLGAESPADRADVIRRLGTLGESRFAPARTRLKQFPELAALMANMADVDATAPNRLAAVLRNDSDAPTLMGMFVLAADPRDAVRLCGLLEKDRQLLLGLAEHDSLDLACWLEPAEMNAEAAAAYRLWVGDLLRTALRDGSGEALDRAALVLTVHAESVRRLLDNDPAFRDQFAADLLPRFEKMIERVDNDGFQQQALLVDPRIWLFLHKYPHRGEELIGRVGPLAIDVLLDPKFETVEPEVIRLFRQADTAVVDGLLDERVRDNPRFIDFLKRSISDEARSRALRTLASNPAEAANLLDYWATLDATALSEEMADPPTGVVTMLPGYATVALLRKAAQGRTVTLTDAVMAGLDAAETFLLLKGGGAVLKTVGTSTRNAALKNVGRQTAEEIGQQTAEVGMELMPWVIEAGHGAVRRAVAEVRKRLVIDATPIVRGMYSRSGVSRNTLHLIDGLDARIFMRRDRRIVIDIAGDHPIGRYLQETGRRAGRVLATEGDPTEGLVVETADMLLAARENAAAWWLGNGRGTLHRHIRQSTELLEARQ